MRKERFHTVSIIVGSMLALAILFSQYLTPECISPDNKTKTEQADKSAHDEGGSFISLPTFSLPAPISVQANLDACLLFEIFFEDYSDESYVEEEISYTDRLFETMFRVIISPNAP